MFVGLHALRFLVLGLLLGPMLRRRLRAQIAEARARGDREAIRRALWRFLQLRYALAGLVLALVWGIRSNTSPLLHALRLLVVMIVVAPLLHWLRTRAAKRTGRVARREFPIRIWIGSKLVLLGISLGLQWLLEKHLSREGAGWLVAGFIFVMVAGVGPLMHREVLRRKWRGAGNDTGSEESEVALTGTPSA